MNTSEVTALVAACLMVVVGGLLVVFRRPFSKRFKSARQRLGLHVGSESHPTMLLVVGLIFVSICVVILVGTFTKALS
jgi:uncharacterized membrane protein YphA (DoxX/SURF4 family)